ncbi:uncharacterized protein A4U43_C02F17340 [Asparagus officinalis]|uniref:Uncharacterized protein n=1 Tax=Asparagus officinalis TaxID=4686 RepID=A0A5P1FJ29_ASPOF|nr:uncharacterized protein A4U43_C02F17340 [Asparagus officinalis]
MRAGVRGRQPGSGREKNERGEREEGKETQAVVMKVAMVAVGDLVRRPVRACEGRRSQAERADRHRLWAWGGSAGAAVGG